MQAKNIPYFSFISLLFILHVRALLGAAGLRPNWGLQPPSCKVLGRQTSSDLQLGAHAMSLLRWAIKGKWVRDFQIPLAILTYILSNRVVAARIDYKHMLKSGEPSRPQQGAHVKDRWRVEIVLWSNQLLTCSCILYIGQSITFLSLTE